MRPAFRRPMVSLVRIGHTIKEGTMHETNNGLSRRSFLKGTAAGIMGAGALGMGAFSLVGCSGGEGAGRGGASGPVTASATAPGYGGDVTVELTVDTGSGAVQDAAIEGALETPSRGGRAITTMQQEMLDAGSIQVDAVSGATVTSTAIQDASAAAYNEAMGASTNLEVRMAPGKYTGKAKGYWQIWDLPVTITVNETSILKIDVPTDRFEHGETEVILQSVKDSLFPRIIENQSIAVDAVSGATVTSNAVKTAIKQALQEALVAGGSNAGAVSMFQIAPERVQEEPEERSVDVLVVGMGTGGIIAMKSACETIQALNGDGRVSLLAIDRAGKYGGKSALTHEGCAVNPPQYQADKTGGKPFVDAEAFKQTWKQFTTTEGKQHAKEDVLDTYFAESGKTIDWLYETGWIFGDMGKENRFTGGLTSYNVALTSNVDTGTYEDRRKILNSYYQQMVAEVAAQGGEYLLETEGYAFLTEGDKVVGVKARNRLTGKEYTIHAKAVIMNTGGFSANPDMVDALLDERWRGERKRIGTDQDTGLMIQAALDIGAGTYNIGMSPNVMHVSIDHWLHQFPINFYDDVLDGRTGRYKVWTLNNIPLACGISANTVAVNKEGKRYMNEAKYESFSDDPEHESWPCFAAGNYYYTIISDDVLQGIANEGFNNIYKWEGYCAQGDIPADLPVPEVYEGLGYAIDEGMAWKGETLSELAEQIGIEGSVLEATIDEYNKLCDAGEDTAFGKDPKYLAKFTSGPYYAVQIFTTSFSTCGGLDVDPSIRVLKDDHQTPIEGLYAIGVDSMGVLLNPNRNYVGFGGVAQGWLWTSGRLAGINAATYVKDAYGEFTYVSPALVDVEAQSSAR